MNKQNEKYKTMLRRKNKEKKIYKDKNSSLQFEKQKLYRALLNREQEIERLNNIIKEVREYIESIEKVDCRYFDYNRALKEMLISYEDLKKKVEEDETLEGHFIEINKLKLLEILEKENK